MRLPTFTRLGARQLGVPSRTTESDCATESDIATATSPVRFAAERAITGPHRIAGAEAGQRTDEEATCRKSARVFEAAFRRTMTA